MRELESGRALPWLLRMVLRSIRTQISRIVPMTDPRCVRMWPDGTPEVRLCDNSADTEKELRRHSACQALRRMTPIPYFPTCLAKHGAAFDGFALCWFVSGRGTVLQIFCSAIAQGPRGYVKLFLAMEGLQNPRNSSSTLTFTT